jgi:uncharacterized protein YcbK (DUF882 family)
MRHRPLFLLLAVLAVTFAGPGAIGVDGEAAAAPGKAKPTAKAKAKPTAKAKAKPTAKAKPKAKAKRKTAGKRRSNFSGHGVARDKLRTEPVPRPSGDVWIYIVNFREEIKVNIYDEDGGFNEEALAQLDSGFRCKRTNEVRAVDPRLYETLSTIFDEYGSQRIELISGFRHQKNEGSRHYHAAAADIKIPGIGIRELYNFAESLDTGGMGIGIYPRSGFVHVDWRAPGEPSYRWTDHSGPGQPSARPRKPQS